MTGTMTLSTLVQPWAPSLPNSLVNHPIENLELDSRNVKPGDTFLAVIGHSIDGRRFIDNAIESGASLIIADADDKFPDQTVVWRNECPILYLNQLTRILSPLAGRLYHHDGNALIGVTGTNGKTTVTQLIAQWLELLDVRTAVMGTTGNGFLDNLQQSQNTTGSAVDIQRALSNLTEQGADCTALEISSHGLVQHRVSDLHFSVGVFTNLSRDHLDYHGSMSEYADAKKQLFTTHDCKNAVLNIDDETAKGWLSEISNTIAVSLKANPEHERSIWARKVHYSTSGIEIAFSGSWGEGSLSSQLIGEFNASNLLVAFAALLALGYDKELLISVSSKLKPVIGRMELFQSSDKAKVVVDYAHTPDALEKALQALKVHCDGKLWAIFGCGGDRDKGKRPLMAEVGERFADHVILTDDNPRSEDPKAIVEDMLEGLSQPDLATIHHDRFAALEFAMNAASEQDIILLAGKGHEDYQIFSDRKVHYSDRESAQKLLGFIS